MNESEKVKRRETVKQEYTRSPAPMAIISKNTGIPPRSVARHLASLRKNGEIGQYSDIPNVIKGTPPLSLPNQEYKGVVKELTKRLEMAEEQLAQARSASAKPPQSLVLSTVKHTPDTEVVVTIPDVHGSLMDTDAVRACLTDVALLNPDVVIIMGDLLDCGGFLAQHHVLGYVAQSEYTFEQDVRSANNFLDTLQANAPHAKIYYLEGNHERRMETFCVTSALRNNDDARYLRSMFGPEIVLNLNTRGIDFLRQGETRGNVVIGGTLKLGNDKVPRFYTHGISACKHAAVRHVERFCANVWYGHTHRRNSVTINTVQHQSIGGFSSGCLCKRQPMYMHTSPENWSHGYGATLVAKSGNFQHVDVLIVRGQSLLMPLLNG